MGKEQENPCVFLTVPVSKEEEIEFRKILFRAGFSLSEFFTRVISSKNIREKYLHLILEDIKKEKQEQISTAIKTEDILKAATINHKNIFDLLEAKSPLLKKPVAAVNKTSENSNAVDGVNKK